MSPNPTHTVILSNLDKSHLKLHIWRVCSKVEATGASFKMKQKSQCYISMRFRSFCTKKYPCMHLFPLQCCSEATFINLVKKAAF